MDGFHSEDFDSESQSEASYESENNLRENRFQNYENQDLNLNTHHIQAYKDQISKLNSENKNLRRQLSGIKGHLNNDLTKIYEKLRKVENKQKNYSDKMHDKKMKRILKDVDFKMKELENEYRKRLNYYQGHKENKRFIDKNYDRVFGPIIEEDDRKDSFYERVYSGTEEESSNRRFFTSPYISGKEIISNRQTTPLRVKYKGINDNSL